MRPRCRRGRQRHLEIDVRKTVLDEIQQAEGAEPVAALVQNVLMQLQTARRVAAQSLLHQTPQKRGTHLQLL